MTERHDLFYELDAFNPRWQTVYTSIFAASSAAGLLDLYTAWLATVEGKRYAEAVAVLPDYVQRVHDEYEGDDEE